jgi:hypothetical protein
MLLSHETKRLLLGLGLLALVGLAPASAEAARLVRVEITVDGKLVLRSSFGDSGREDADEVWNGLKTLRFEATEEFAELSAGDAKEIVLKSQAPVGELGQIVIDVSYGGRAETRELRLIRVAKDRRGFEWQLDPAEVDRLFDDRLIRRKDAKRLKKR